MKTVKNAVDYAEVARQWARRADEIERRYGNYRASEKRYSVGPMPVVVNYKAIVGRVEFFKRAEEHIFIQTKTLPDRTGEQWEEVHESPYSIRDEFFKVKTVGQAIEFLQKTGEFSPLKQRLTWTEFQKWQLFTRLVQEHNELAAAMRSGSRTGDCAEVLKALTGIYPSSFFDGCEDALYVHDMHTSDPAADTHWPEESGRELREAKSHKKFVKALERQRQDLVGHHALQEYEREKEQRRRKLWQWFISPPVTIVWHPIDEEAAQKVVKRHIDSATGLPIPIAEESPIMRGGALIEFLLPQGQLAPVLLIEPKYTLQAIAAAIYAERIQGITYRKCDWCQELFRIDSHKNKLYCDPPKPCRGNAQKQRQRAKQRDQRTLAASKSRKSKGKKVLARKTKRGIA